MAKQIEGVSEKIIAAAKQEFLEKGYVDASLRTIASAAGRARTRYMFVLEIKRDCFPQSLSLC